MATVPEASCITGIDEQRALLQDRLSWMLKVRPLLPFMDEGLLLTLEARDTPNASTATMETGFSLRAIKDFDVAGVTEVLRVLLREGQHKDFLEKALETQSQSWVRKFEALSRFDNFIVSLNISNSK